MSNAAVRVVLVRHGRPASVWGDAGFPDPGLDPTGRAEADAMADALAPCGPMPLLVSPAARTRETAAPLACRWNVEPEVEPVVGELKAPPDPQPDHVSWLRAVMGSSYTDLPADLRAFRDRVVSRVAALRADTVIVTHYIAINAVVGAAVGDDRVVSFAPGHCSRTVVDVSGGSLRLVELGERSDGAGVIVDRG